MQVLEYVYVVSSGVLAATGLTMVGFAVRAYATTQNRPLIHLAIGFVLIVAAALATAISAFVTGFTDVRSLLLVQSGISSLGYLFIVYSLVTY